MTALEIRLILYGALVLALIGFGGWSGYRLTRNHYEAVLAADKAAQQDALAMAQRNVIAAQKAQQVATQQAQKDHEALVTADTQSRNAILGSVRNLETALHLGSLRPAVADPGQLGGAASGTSSPDELTELVGRLNQSIATATAACQHDSSELAGILEIASQTKPVTPP